MSPSLTWVVGRGGLLGRHVEASLAAAEPDGSRWRPASPIRWQDARLAASDLDREAASFLELATQSAARWRLLWCAGAGVVATSPEAVEQETALLDRFLAALGNRLIDHPGLARSGTLFFASSAGGVYAASTDSPPFDERSAVGALAPYGREKLAQEALVMRVAESCETDALIGRLSNLYGAGQDLAKPQGLIAHVGRAALKREPVSIYVTLDTIRDYLYAPDAGRMVAGALLHRETERADGAARASITKIFASEVETTVATVLAVWRQVLRRPLRVALASSPTGRLQPRVLAFRSHVLPELRGQPTLLLLGVDAVRRDQLTRLLATGLA